MVVVSIPDSRLDRVVDFIQTFYNIQKYIIITMIVASSSNNKSISIYSRSVYAYWNYSLANWMSIYERSHFVVFVNVLHNLLKSIVLAALGNIRH